MSQQSDFAPNPVKPKLSICLITYNRARFLESLLQRLTSQGVAGVSHEILLCDNCSTDDTQVIAEAFAERFPQIRYVRQRENVGALNNLLTAYRLAAGTYAIYLADDDLLVPEALAETIGFLDSHPDVVVCHAPWELWDDVANQAHGQFYHVAEQRVFDREKSLDLVDYIVGHHIFPEISVYRTSALHRMYVAPSIGFSAFVYLAVSLNFGQVAFLPRPFYRSVTRHSTGLARQQTGNTQVTTELDSYRAGLEVLFSAAFRFQGLPGVPASKRETVQKMIQAFIGVRMSVALRFFKMERKFVAAMQTLSRLQACGGLTDDQINAERKSLIAPMLTQTVLELCSGVASISELVLCDLGEAPSAVDMFQALKPGFPVRIQTEAALLESGMPATAMVMTASAEQRDRLIAGGFPSGLVVSEQELLRVLAVY